MHIRHFIRHPKVGLPPNLVVFVNATTLAGVSMCVVHDLAEAQGNMVPSVSPLRQSQNILFPVGDIAPREGIPKEVKQQLKAEAMHNFVHDMLHDSPAAQRISSLWLVSYNTFREVYESHRS